MSTITLPNKFWRPLAEVKNFVEKMTNGVRLPQMSQKVKSFASLNRKDKDILIRYLNDRDCIHVIQARPLSGGNLTTFFYHHKFGLPDEIPGFDWVGKKASIMMPIEEPDKPDISEIETAETLIDDIENEEDEEPLQETKNPVQEKAPMAQKKSETVKEVPDSSNADDLRKRALEMLMQADEADQSRLSQVLTSEIKPKIDEFILRLNTANDAVQSTLDKLYDQMADIDKISMEFKNFAQSL